MPAIAGIQLLLAGVILTLTALLVFVGIQVVFILRDVRKTLKKVNEGVGQSPRLSTLSFFEKLITKQNPLFKEETDTVLQQTNVLQQTGVLEQTEIKPDSYEHIMTLQEKGRQRVFQRGGKPLA